MARICGGRLKPDLGGKVGKLILSLPTLHPQWLQLPGPTPLCTGSQWLGKEQRGEPVGPFSHSYPLSLPMAKWG